MHMFPSALHFLGLPCPEPSGRSLPVQGSLCGVGPGQGHAVRLLWDWPRLAPDSKVTCSLE